VWDERLWKCRILNETIGKLENENNISCVICGMIIEGK